MRTAPQFTILVVDDELSIEPLIRQRMRREIRRKQYGFIFAHNGVEAINVLRKHNEIDMLLADINMPQMDGLTLLKQLPDINPHLKAVMISANKEMDNIRAAMNLGAFDFVVKPIDWSDLQVTIKRTLQHLKNWREALAARDQLVAIKRELDIAGQMQQATLPTSFPATERYNISANMEPAREVGGDMYDILPLPYDRVFATVADVSGKGIPAALMMMSIRTALKGAVIGSDNLSDTLAETNNLISQDAPAEMFATVISVIYDTRSGKCSYAAAGHPPPILVKADGQAQELPMQGGIAIGIEPNFPYENHTVTLQTGESLILYSDGVTEAMTEHREEFGLSRMLHVFEGQPPQSAEEASKRVFEAVHSFVGQSKQSDDITCLCLHHNCKV